MTAMSGSLRKSMGTTTPASARTVLCEAEMRRYCHQPNQEDPYGIHQLRHYPDPETRAKANQGLD